VEDIDFPVNTLVGYAVGWDMFIFKTTDGGVTWDSMRPMNTGGKYAAIHTVQFPVNDQVGYFGGTGFDIYKTTDGCMTWSSQPVPAGIVYSICFPNDNHTGYAACCEACILKTTDGGGTFVTEQPGSTVAGSQFCVLPNPFRSSARVPGHAHRMFDIYDVTGCLAMTCRGSDLGGNLKPGIYFITPRGAAGPVIKIIKIP
jgi:hypothetical protein